MQERQGAESLYISSVKISRDFLQNNKRSHYQSGSYSLWSYSYTTERNTETEQIHQQSWNDFHIFLFYFYFFICVCVCVCVVHTLHLSELGCSMIS